jgi:hypothetical protein
MPIIKPHQNIIDVAMQHAGAAEAAFNIASDNGLSLTNEPTPGVEVLVNEVVNQRVVFYFNAQKNIDCTTIRNDQNLLKQGIGYWRIGYNFKVS